MPLLFALCDINQKWNWEWGMGKGITITHTDAMQITPKRTESNPTVACPNTLTFVGFEFGCAKQEIFYIYIITKHSIEFFPVLKV
jgi:hypothetical protein